jgi:hypothetical protein
MWVVQVVSQSPVRPWTKTTLVREASANKRGMHALDRRVFWVIEQMLEEV